ncbi:MAG: hypothetical protein CL913_00210 [Deltaproteobacteria bacterium]|nr:hypothetical protein [Deltaproteobacteria bacterium]
MLAKKFFITGYFAWLAQKKISVQTKRIRQTRQKTQTGRVLLAKKFSALDISPGWPKFFFGPNKANKANKAKDANRASFADQKIFIAGYAASAGVGCGWLAVAGWLAGWLSGKISNEFQMGDCRSWSAACHNWLP